MLDRLFFFLGSLLGLAAVVLGAFGSHLLKQRLSPEDHAIFEIAVRYQFYHALALLAASWACIRWSGPWPRTAGWLFFAGNLLFSGSLYLLALTAARWLGAITPFGGLCLIAGWLCLMVAAWKAGNRY